MPITDGVIREEVIWVATKKAKGSGAKAKKAAPKKAHKSGTRKAR
jgi:hypothetical protein